MEINQWIVSIQVQSNQRTRVLTVTNTRTEVVHNAPSPTSNKFNPQAAHDHFLRTIVLYFTICR